MPAFVTLDSVAYRTPDGRSLFDDLTLAFGRERTGLVGRNGVGKTTLLRLILGELAPSAGALSVAGRLGVLRQTLAPATGASIADLAGLAEPFAMLARIEAGQGSEADFAEADWAMPARFDAALASVGLAGFAPDRPAASLSGGQATRAALAGLIAAEPDLLVLDEPTNNLDAEARDLVAEVIGGWRGGAIVVSHDRDLLRRMDRIVELSGLGARIYGGGYDLYAARKAEEEAAARHALDDARREAAQIEREVQTARERKDRRDSGGRRHKLKGDMPRIVLGAMQRRAEATSGRLDLLAERKRGEAAADLAEAEARVERVQRLAFDLPPSGLAAGKLVLAFEQVGFAWPGQPPLLRGLDLRLVGPERVAVSGPNGSGKTTLIGLAVGALEPTAGRVIRGAPTVLMDQQTAILSPAETLLEAFQRLNPGATANAAHAALARFLFRNQAAHRRVGELSGGERLRAALACTLAGLAPPQLLILDEPTNHLDLDSIAAVEDALAGYDGALLVVSHDRDFLERIAIERTVALR